MYVRFWFLASALAVTAAVYAQSASWHPYRVADAELSFSAPAKPTSQQAALNGAPSTFWTSDSPAGHFVAGYTPFVAQIQPRMKDMISSDPGGDACKGLVKATVAAFAKGGKAKITSDTYGMDRGLPADFATLSNGKVTLNVRVYLCSKRVYTFVAIADEDSTQHFFDSIKIPAELKDSGN